jgi:hypothetical protein
MPKGQQRGNKEAKKAKKDAGARARPRRRRPRAGTERRGPLAQEIAQLAVTWGSTR